MNKRIIVVGLAATLLGSGAYLLAHQQAKQPAALTQSTTQTESTSRIQKDYEAIANRVKNDKEPVVVGKVFKDGYLKKHGNHYHYVKGVPPKDAIYEHVDTADLADDGYQFDPKDIVEENEFGYVVRHGNHFHFIPKKNLNQIARTQHTKPKIGSGVTPLPSIPSNPQTLIGRLEKRIAEIMQKYGLRRDQIIVNEQEGTIIYPHGDHYHYEKIGAPHHDHDHDHEQTKPKPDTKEQDKGNSGKDNQSDKNQPPKENDTKQDKPKEDNTDKPKGQDARKAAIAKRVAEIMKRYGLRRDQIIVNEQEGTIVYPHGNHYHYERIDDPNHDDHDHDHDHDNEHHDHTKPDKDKPKEDDSKQDNKKEDKPKENTETPKDNNISKEMNDMIAKRVAEIMKKYGLTRDKIKVDVANNAIIYPHGNHYHYEKIDPNKPLTNYNRHGIPEEKDDGLAHTETHKIVGPLALTRDQLLNKEAILKAYPNLPIKNIDHYHIVGFQAVPNSRVKVGDLKQDGKLTEGIAYLVLKNIPWKEVAETVKVPETQPKEGYYFKEWTHALPTEGVVDRPRVFGAQFRLEKFKNSPVVLGPSATRDIPGTDNIDIHDYVPVSFHALPNGHLIVNGQKVKHAFYLIKQGTTWRQAFANGFKLPETSPDTEFEFTGFSQDVTKKLDEKVGSEFVWAKFGATVPVVGVYQPTDANNPLSESDPKRPHPRDSSFPYNPEKYATIAIRAKGNGYLSTHFEEGKVLTYVVRKGTSWKELQGELPNLIAEKGYRVKDGLPQGDESIESNRIYDVTFEKEPTTTADTETTSQQQSDEQSKSDGNQSATPKESESKQVDSTSSTQQNVDAAETTKKVKETTESTTKPIEKETEASKSMKQTAKEEIEASQSTEQTAKEEVETLQSTEHKKEETETAPSAN